MTERDFAEQLSSLLELRTEELTDVIDRVRTFDESGLLTHDTGLVITLDDGSEFQLSIVQSAGHESEGDDDE
jgi:hypothetical protein